MKSGDHPSDLNEHKIGQGLDVLVIDRLALLDALDHDGIRRRGDRQVPERPRIAPPVCILDPILKDTEYIQLVRIPHGVGGDG